MSILLALALMAADPAASGSGEPVMEEAVSEHEAIQAVIDRLYAVISGPVGAPRDWDGLRGLMTDNARMTPIGAKGPTSHDVDSYIERSERLLVSEGFHEVETGRRIEIFGNMAHVWSAYEGRTGSHDGPIVVTGINSIQLVRQADGWKVFSILWQPASAGLPVPADLAQSEMSEESE